MFGTIKKKLTLAAVVAAGAMAVPVAASAQTPVPPLPPGATQAFASVNGTTPITAPTNRVFTGSVSWTGPGGVTITCGYNANYLANPGGTGFVQAISFNPLPCATSVAGCFATVTSAPPPNDTWGRRLISWPGVGAPGPGRYDIINAALQVVYTGTCPLPTGVPFDWTGVLWFRGGPFGGPPVTVSSTSATPPYNVLSSPTFGSSLLVWTAAIGGGQPPLFIL